MSACTVRERAALLVGGEQRDEAAVVERVATAAELVGRARQRLHEPARDRGRSTTARSSTSERK